MTCVDPSGDDERATVNTPGSTGPCRYDARSNRDAHDGRDEHEESKGFFVLFAAS
jgi:hypothetical protein